MAQSWAELEMEGAAVSDRRCKHSLARICERRFDRPLVSFSKACGDAARQAAHRICSHPKATVDGLLRGHFEQTARRAYGAWREDPSQLVLVVQDTTDLKYTGHHATEGLGPIHTSSNGRGLFAHPALALPLSGPPFGLVHLSIWARDVATHGKRRQVSERAAEATALKESQKWLDGLWGAEASLSAELPLLVIADREADFYDFFAAERRANTHLLIRARHPRKVWLTAPSSPLPPSDGSLPEVLAEAPCLGTMELNVPRKPGQAARTACLEVRAVCVWIQAPDLRKRDDELRDRLPRQVWVVEVREVDPPEGTTPVQWVLLTTLPTEDLKGACQVVRYYRRRWVIEELSLVLKSGLGAERLQMDDADTLKNTLALLYVVAWRVLHVRDTSRFLPDRPAAELVNEEEREVLEAVAGRPLKTAADVVHALARLAGFPKYPSAGPPGVRTLAEALLRLDAAVLGWRLARQPLSYEPR